MPELALSPPGEEATPSPHKGSQVHLRGCTGEQFMLLMTAGGITVLQSGWYYTITIRVALHYYNRGGITVLQNAKVGPRLHPAYIILTSVHLLKVWISR